MELTVQECINNLHQGLRYLSRVYDNVSAEDKAKLIGHKNTVLNVTPITHPSILVNLIDLTHLYLDQMNEKYDAEVEEFLIMIQERYD